MPVFDLAILGFNLVSRGSQLLEMLRFLEFLLLEMQVRFNPNPVRTGLASSFVAAFFHRANLAFFHIEIIGQHWIFLPAVIHPLMLTDGHMAGRAYEHSGILIVREAVDAFFLVCIGDYGMESGNEFKAHIRILFGLGQFQILFAGIGSITDDRFYFQTGLTCFFHQGLQVLSIAFFHHW